MNLLWLEDEIELAFPDTVPWLERHGICVTVCKNYVEACEALKDKENDAIIIDLFLPGCILDGRSIVGHEIGMRFTEYVQMTNHDMSRVFILSGNVEDSVASRLEALGVLPKQIYYKPIIDEYDLFVDSVINCCKDKYGERIAKIKS